MMFSGWAVPPDLAALAVEVSVKDERPKAPRKKVETVPLCVTETTFGVLLVQLGRPLVEELHDVDATVLESVTCAGGFAEAQFEAAVCAAFDELLVCSA
jgi:hypothetical protein